jgi:predicted RNA methylase
MALADAFGADAPYDPGQGVDDLARQTFPGDISDSGVADPGRLSDTLMRRMDRKTRHIDEKPVEPVAEKPPSSYGEPVVTGPKPSSFGEVVKPPEAPVPTLGPIDQTVAAGKGAAQGFIKSGGAILQAGAIKDNTPEKPEASALIDQLGTAGTLDAGGKAKLMKQALTTITDRGLQMDYNAALQRISGGADAQAEMEGLRQKFGTFNAQPSVPVTERPLYKGGAAIKKSAEDTIPMSPAEKESFGGKYLGPAVGGMVAPVAVGAINPALGITLGAATMAAQSAGDTFEAAKAKNASDEDAAKAAGMSALVSGALGAVPLGVILTPVKKFAPALSGWAAETLNKYVASAAFRKTAAFAGTMAAVVEAQEYLGDQIAQKYYDPKAEYSPDIKRVIASLITGVLLGAGHAYMEGRKKPGDVPPTPDTPPDITPDTPPDLPPPPPPHDDINPDTGAGSTGTGSDTGGSNPGGGAGNGNTGQGQQRQKRERQKTNEQTDVRTKLERILRYFGHSDEDIAAMSHEELVAAVNKHTSQGEAPVNNKEEPLNPQGESATERTEREGLKRAGWTDAHIAVMTPAERRRRFQEAMARGSASERPPEQEAQQNTAEKPVPQPTAETTGTGTRDNPINIRSADDVLKASEVVAKDPTDPQAAATNFKHGHAEIEHLGLTGKNSISLETGVGDTRKGTEQDGTPWEVKMPVAYGRIKGTTGADGEPLDVFIGAHPDSQHVFVIDQHHAGGKGEFDEHKIMTGFRNPIEALHAYANSYTDGGADRIGGMKALAPDEFKDWLRNGDHSQPIGAIGRAEVMPPAPVTAEPTKEHHAQIEAALGEDYHHVLPVDTARAAEILAENEGMLPHVAFGHAVIENLVGQKFLTHQQAEQAYGEEVNTLLQPGSQGASGSGTPSEQERPASGQVGAGSATETPVAASGGENGAQGETGKPGDGSTAGGGTAKPAARGNKTAGDKTGDATEHQPAAEDANDTVVEEGDPNLTPNEKAALTFALKDKEHKWHRTSPMATSARDILERGKTESDQEVDVLTAALQLHDRETKRRQKAEEEKKPSVDEPVPEPEKQKIEDVGEKIGGARKDQWTGGLTKAALDGMTGGELDTNVTKHNIWPRPDYAAVVDSGVAPVAAALMKRVYDRIAVKPTNRYNDTVSKEDRDNYFDALKAIRDEFAKVKTVDEMKKVSQAVSAALGTNSYSVLAAIRQRGSRNNPLTVMGADVRTAEGAVAKGFPNMEPWQRLFEIDPYTPYDYEKKAVKEKVWIVRRKNGGKVGEFGTRELAEAAAKEAYAKISKGGSEEQEPNRPHLDAINRDGPDYRKDRDVGSDDFKDTFGFRGVEFGNWAANDERQKVLNLAFDALHDLARILNLPAKAMSLDGTLAIGFGSRGKGGKGAGAAHYEADRTVINMTKINGAGSLAHEWIHALDHYLGEFATSNPYGGGAKWISNGRVTPKNTAKAWRGRFLGSMSDASAFNETNTHLKPRLRVGVNKLMHDLFNKEQDDEQAIADHAKKLEHDKGQRQAWIDHANRIKDRMRKGGSSMGLKKAEENIGIRDHYITNAEKADTIARKVVPTDYLKEATKLSGKGDYWRRPLELLARAGEAFVFDKIQEEGFTSQYLVQGVEPTRYAAGFKGNPYPVGEERKTINADFERVLKALTTGEGKHGINTRVQAVEGEPEPIVTRTRVEVPRPQPMPIHEMIAVDEASKQSLSDAFAKHFTDGLDFTNILAARKFAHDAGFPGDPKATEEAIEFGIVKVARGIVDAGGTPKEIYDALVGLYGRQPRLGTRTSTSVRDQAYSTPVPLGYIASELAGITKDTTVYEPTAGNGALLIGADPKLTIANEINPDRAGNLKEQGFNVSNKDALERHQNPTYDVVIANPPFGAVRESTQYGVVSKVFDMGDIQPNYQTHEIDHAIALRALAAMKDNGKAVLILGGVNRMATTREARSDAYNGKAKREFFKTLYDKYDVTDHFTVSGDLYERQGAGWPVDVIVINGRGKSSRALPAVDVPRIFNDWTGLGGLLDGQPNRSDAGTAGGQHVSDDVERPGLAGSGIGDTGDAGQGGDRAAAGGENPAGVVQQPVSGAGNAGAGGGGDQDALGAGEHNPADRSDSAAPAIGSSSGLDLDALISGAIKDAYAEPVSKPAAGPRTSGGPRTTKENVKSAGENMSAATDAAFSGLYQLFGGGKTHGAGPAFDEDTYAKAKPFFKTAAEHYRSFWGDIGELIRRMVEHMRDTLKFGKEAMQDMAQYLKRFIQDLTSGEIKLGEKEQTKDESPDRERAKAGTATETEGQVRNTPKSKIENLDTLVPANLKRPQDASLDDLERRVGPIDDFVAKELDYKKADLPKYFGAEQIDALGLAIDNIKNGNGFIIGDQTGIGKGRVNAAIIKWAIKNDRIPVFVTMSPNLYADIYRDMKAIGMTDEPPRILATNADLDMPLEEGGATLKNGQLKEHDRVLGSVSGKEAFQKHFDMVFTNYSQMQTVKGEDTGRRAFLKAIAPHSVVIMDESHNAGGTEVGRKKAANEPANRSGFARELIQNANGVFYSSATYAKRPDVMDLYSATNMKMAVADPKDLGEAIARGGVPMQQAVATMLAEDGQYIRRERSFAGIEYNTPLVGVDRENYNTISSGLSAIQDFSAAVKAAMENVNADLMGEGGTTGYDGATGDSGAQSTNFTSIMHNVINQMLLAMKVEPAAQAAIEAIKRGEKPVLTVANTMESFLKDYADTIGVKVGDEMPADFSDVLHKYLERTRMITIKKPFMKKGEKAERRRLTDEELGPAGVASYERAKEIIGSMNLSEMPVSPIDHLIWRLKKEGYSVGEITGRGLILDYSGKGDPVLRKRPGKDLTTAGKNETLRKFNTKPVNGGHHALIINQSGSTGLSAHASRDFNDQSVRHMMIVQPEGNVDTHMQLLGRINRTGQVVLPRYTQFVADIPAEKRPAAVLAKKMASLNANTTASRTSAVTAKDVPDFINEYGDIVAANYLSENFEMNPRLAMPIKFTESGRAIIPDAMRKLTGRIPLLPLHEQEALYQELESAYEDMMKQLSAAGTNPMEAKTFDLKAKSLETTEVMGRKNDSNSRFAAPVNVEKVSVARLGKPYTPAEVMGKVIEAIGDRTAQAAPDEKAEIKDLARLLDQASDTYQGLGKASAANEIAERQRAIKEFAEYIKPILEGMPDAEKQAKEKSKFDAIKDRWSAVHKLVRIGQRVTLKTADGNLTGIITKVEQKGVTKNPLALSSWKAEFAIADASRHMTLPFSRIHADGKADSESALDVEVVPLQRWIESAEQTLDRYKHMQSDAREERYIATGNLLAAYDWLGRKGNIINYTDDKGGVRQGILTSRDFDLEKHAVDKGRVVHDPFEIRDWLDRNPTETIWSKGQTVSIRREGRWSKEYVIATDKAKKTGGVFFLDKPLIDLAAGDFISRSGRMVTDVTDGNILGAIKRLQELGAVFTLKAEAPKPTKVEEPLASITEAATEKQPEIEGLIRDVLQHLVGDHVKAEFSPDLMSLAGTAGGWGAMADRSPGARGLYYPSRHLIKLALLHGVDSAAFHEAYHAIEYQLQSPQERALMERETGRIRDYIRKTRGYSKEQADGLDPEEVRAIGFEDYATDRSKGEGLHVGVRRWYHRLWEAIKRLANGLRGLGFETYEDIFDKAYRGKYAKAKGDTPRPEAAIHDDEPLASIFEKRTKANGRVSEAIGNLFNDSKKADFVEAFSDLSHREKLLQKEVEARYLGLTPEEAKKVFPEASKLPDAMQFYVKKELIPGKVAYQANDFRNRLLKPLIETANKAEITLPDLGDYLMAKGALERNRNIGPLYQPGHPFNDAMRDNNIAGGSGFSNNEARDKIRAFESGPQGQAYKDIWRQTRNIVDFNRQMMVHYGLESQATIDAWKANGPDYVPFKGFEEADIDDEKYFGGKGSPIGIRAPETKRAFGRMSKADNPMVHLIDQAYRTIERGERNMHYNSIAETLATLKHGGINTDDFVSLNKGTPKKTIDPKTGLARWVDTSPSAMAKGAVNFKRNGAPRTMLFKSEKLAQSINRNSPWSFPGLNKVLLGVNKLKSMWTHYSPDFAARHFFGRYMVEGALNAYQLRDTGAYSPWKWTADAFPAFGRASRAISNFEKGRPSGQLGKYWAEMKAQGGNMAFRSMRDIDTIKNELVDDLKQITTSTRLNPLRVLKGIADKTDEIFNVWDNATRLATYAQARDQGMTPQAAAYRARNATVNYQKRAIVSSVAGTIFPFYNTAVRTGTRLTSALTQSGRMRRVFAGVFAAGVALALNNYLLGGSDDNGDPYFEKVPDFERALGFIFLNPFERDAQGRPQKYALPNAYNYALPMTFGYHLTGMFLDKIGAIKSKITVGEHAAEMVKSTLMAFTPLGEFGNLMDMITPELLRPLAHVIENKNWLGNPVHNDMFQKGPNSESGRKPRGDYMPTGEGWKTAAKTLNSWTGGDAHHSGLIDRYPEDIRELTDQMFGAQKRFGIEVGNTAGSIMKGETPKATDIPIAKVFRGIDYDQADAVARAKHRYEQKHPWEH